MNKTEGVSYISDAQYMGQATPGPGGYKVDEQHTRSRSPVLKWQNPPERKNHYKITKSKEPDVGTYNPGKSKDVTSQQRKTIVTTFARPKEPGAPEVEKVTYTKAMARSKKWMPGVGSYDPKDDFQHKPYLRSKLV